MTIRDNSQRSDAVKFGLVLAPELLGSVGCFFAHATVDEKVGPEVILIFTEEPAYARRYGAIGDQRLLASTAILKTPHGPVGAIVWQIAAGSPSEVYVEQFINPASDEAVALVREASHQTRLRLAVVDNRSSDLCVVFDYENSYRLDDFVRALDGAKADAKPESYAEAKADAKANGRLIEKIRAGATG